MRLGSGGARSTRRVAVAAHPARAPIAARTLHTRDTSRIHYSERIARRATPFAGNNTPRSLYSGNKFSPALVESAARGRQAANRADPVHENGTSPRSAPR